MLVMSRTTKSGFMVTSSMAAALVMACGAPVQEAPPPAPLPTSAVAPAPAPAVVAAPTAEPKAEEHHAPHWTYAGDTGPGRWGELASEWASCRTGASQSPIDLVTKGMAVDAKLPKPEFSYGKLPLSILNNGHTVQVPNSTQAGIKLGERAYQLVQFHMHTPSEHLVDGKPLELELHLVHTDASGAITVVGMLFKKGKENEALKSVFANAPAEITEEAKPVDKTELDLAKLLPKNLRYYSYSGSLTTPPCSEGVNWVVMQSVGEVSDAQLAKFREVTHGDTVRPAQPLGTRKVTRTK
jgi:carbonic anhydrase